MSYALLLAFLTAGSQAFSQPVYKSPDFPALDRNGDGFLSRREAAADPEIGKRFAQFDADGDRLLSQAEHLAARQDNERRAQRDAVLKERVKAALSAERGIPTAGIAIDTYEGAVHLSGFVPAPDMASRAGRISAAVSGVRTVHNNITVK